jgi:hypothetical protein
LPAFERADDEKIAPHVLSVALLQGDLSPAMREKLTAIRTKRAVLAAEAVAVVGLARQVDSRLLFVRGFSLVPAYPSGYVRQFNDLDIVVASEPELERLLTALEARGYFFSRPAVVRRGMGDGTTAWALLSLNRHDPSLDEPIILDVELGGVSTNALAHLPLPASMFDAPAMVALDEGLVPAPDADHGLLVLIAELYERPRITLRDLLDADRLEHLLRRPEQVVETVRRRRMEPQVGRLAAAAEALGETDLGRRLRRLAPGARSAWSGSGRTAALSTLVRSACDESVWTAPARISAALAEPLLRAVEERAPRAALRSLARLPPRWAYRLGLPVHLFPLHPEPRLGRRQGFSDVGRPDVFDCCGRSFLARWRPLLDETELDDLVTGTYTRD